MFKKYGDNAPIQIITPDEDEVNPAEVRQSIEQLQQELTPEPILESLPAKVEQN